MTMTTGERKVMICDLVLSPHMASSWKDFGPLDIVPAWDLSEHGAANATHQVIQIRADSG